MWWCEKMLPYAVSRIPFCWVSNSFGINIGKVTWTGRPKTWVLIPALPLDGSDFGQVLYSFLTSSVSRWGWDRFLRPFPAVTFYGSIISYGSYSFLFNAQVLSMQQRRRIGKLHTHISMRHLRVMTPSIAPRPSHLWSTCCCAKSCSTRRCTLTLGYENSGPSSKIFCHSRDGLGRDFGQLQKQRLPPRGADWGGMGGSKVIQSTFPC